MQDSASDDELSDIDVSSQGRPKERLSVDRIQSLVTSAAVSDGEPDDAEARREKARCAKLLARTLEEEQARAQTVQLVAHKGDRVVFKEVRIGAWVWEAEDEESVPRAGKWKANAKQSIIGE